jgi:hypothetical protein
MSYLQDVLVLVEFALNREMAELLFEGGRGKDKALEAYWRYGKESVIQLFETQIAR